MNLINQLAAEAFENDARERYCNASKFDDERSKEGMIAYLNTRKYSPFIH
jgi:hypothetical protein